MQKGRQGLENSRGVRLDNISARTDWSDFCGYHLIKLCCSNDPLEPHTLLLPKMIRRTVCKRTMCACVTDNSRSVLVHIPLIYLYQM